MLKIRARGLAAAFLALTSCHATAQLEEWAGNYRCDAMKSDPDGRPGFSSRVKLTVKDGAANLLRDSGRIRDSMSGIVGADGRVILEGTGQFKDSGTSWRFRFEGQFEGAKFEGKGAMYPARGGTVLRDCTMALSRVSVRPARQAKLPPLNKEPAVAPPAIVKEPPPPPVQAISKAEPPPAPPKPELPMAVSKPEPPPPAVREALETHGPDSPQTPKQSSRAYSRTGFPMIVIFIVCALVGVGLIAYDLRLHHNKYLTPATERYLSRAAGKYLMRATVSKMRKRMRST